MNCQKVRSCLSAYSEGLLSSEKSHELEAHIRSCKSCEQEKAFHQQLLAAAQSLPKKTLPEDFNLQLMNRIYAEQSRPTESFLPAEALALRSGYLKWVSAVATVMICAVATVFVLQQMSTPSGEQMQAPEYTAVEPAPVVTPASARYQNPARLRAYDDMIGVSGPASNYRSTNLEALRAFQISRARIESLYVANQRKLGQPVIPAQYRTSFRNAGIRTHDVYRDDREVRLQPASQKR